MDNVGWRLGAGMTSTGAEPGMEAPYRGGCGIGVGRCTSDVRSRSEDDVF